MIFDIFNTLKIWNRIYRVEWIENDFIIHSNTKIYFISPRSFFKNHFRPGEWGRKHQNSDSRAIYNKKGEKFNIQHIKIIWNRFFMLSHNCKTTMNCEKANSLLLFSFDSTFISNKIKNHPHILFLDLWLSHTQQSKRRLSE